MKWPKKLVLIRHGESAYNALKKIKATDPDYLAFQQLFDTEFAATRTRNWPSNKLIQLAEIAWEKIRLPYSDADTPMTEAGKRQARLTGEALKESGFEIPDKIYLSPYLRIITTYTWLCQGWPEIADVPMEKDPRLREQEHGLQTIYNDWRICYTFHPEQGLLYKLEGSYKYRYLNGESQYDSRLRNQLHIGKLIRDNSNQIVWEIIHHLTLLSYRANIEGWDEEKFIETDDNEKPVNCGVTIFECDSEQGKDGRLILKSYNQKYY